MVLLPSESQPIFHSITNSNPVKVIKLDNPESVLITPSHRSFISLIVSVCQIKNVIVGHTKDISDLNDTGLSERSGQRMVRRELKNIFDDMLQGQLAISSRENHNWICPFLVVTRERARCSRAGSRFVFQ
jgi:hypothetical protein